MSSQRCAAFWPIYMAINGKDMTEGEYDKLKERDWKATTGLRMWLPSDLNNAAINVDAGETEYKLMDWTNATALLASGLAASAVLLQ